jgi:hypothetical protein
MSNNPLQTLQETHQALKEGCEELKLTFEDLRVGRCTIDQKQEVVDRIKALKELYQRQVKEFSVDLPDGRSLLRPQYEALEMFARNNDRKVERLLDGVTINGGVIVGCKFSDRALTTLEGLRAVWSIKRLDVRGNKRLTSLKGIPTQEIAEICARDCRLTGDLSEIAEARELRHLDVYWNPGLVSLQGIPVQEIVYINAVSCGLIGDLSEIIGATKLKELCVSGNKGLTSLKGIPTKEIEEIYASECRLTGDHTFLSQAKKLRSLLLNDNPNSLTLDISAFSQGVVAL